MTPTTPFPRMRAFILCLLLALAAGCDKTPAKHAQAPKAALPPASADAVALIQGQRLDKVLVVALARYLPRPSRPTPGEVSQATFACLEKADTQEITHSIARELDGIGSKQEIADALAFLRSPHGQKFAELEWVTAVNGVVSGSALVATDMSAEELAIVDAHTLTPQHTKFVAAVQKAVDTKAHDSLAMAVIGKCEKTGK